MQGLCQIVKEKILFEYGKQIPPGINFLKNALSNWFKLRLCLRTNHIFFDRFGAKKTQMCKFFYRCAYYRKSIQLEN